MRHVLFVLKDDKAVHENWQNEKKTLLPYFKSNKIKKKSDFRIITMNELGKLSIRNAN